MRRRVHHAATKSKRASLGNRPFMRRPFRGSIAMVQRVATSIQKGLSKLSPKSLQSAVLRHDENAEGG
jgi:hypothetical protein